MKWQAVLREITLNPAAALYVLNAIIAMVVGWGWHATPDQLRAADTIATGVLTITAAFLVRPVGLAAASAAAITVLTAFGAFHLHWTPAVISTTVATASVVLGFTLHALGSPAVAVKQGKTAAQLMLERGKAAPVTAAHP